MTNKSQQQNGYILVLTMIIMSLLVTLVTRMALNSTLFSSFASVVIHREKAKMLAQSGAQIACGQLYIPASTQEKPEKLIPGKQPEKQEQADQTKKLLEQIIPVLNTWQTFKFDQATSGIDGILKIYITCEEGKIHLNDLLTLMTDAKLQANQRTAMQHLFTKIAGTNSMSDNLYTSAVDFFEQRKHVWLNDITELLTAHGFESFFDRIFVAAPTENKKQAKTIFLTDLFTPQSRYGKLVPWVFSRSVCLALGITNPEDVNNRLKAALKSYKKSYNWNVDWDVIFEPVYGIKFAALGKEISLYLPSASEPFNPVAFSVTSYATVGKVTQGIFALLIRKKQQDQSMVFIPIKFYWI